MTRSLLIVESPSKAKTLKKYLGRNFEVLASYGHVRDLEAKEGAVDPEHGFRMRYALVEKNKKHMDAIARAAEDADQVLLATDPDREGEAIAWHLSEILKGKKSLKSRPVRRVVFYEITESAVKEGVAHPRDISMPLVNAQQARRALDHLVGFNLSPLLWKKIGPSLSAGRVQSPALRLIVEREQEIESFKTREYWTVHLESHKGKDKFSARLTQYKGEKVEQFTITTDAQQQAVVNELVKERQGQGHRDQGGAQAQAALSVGAFHHVHAAAGSRAQARHDCAACHAYRARALRRRGHRRRDRGLDHLHAHRLHQPRQ